MTLPESLRRIAAMTLPLLGSLMLAMPAQAACGLTAESVARAEVAFVGTLTAVSADGAIGTFEIEDVWRSAEIGLAGTVEVAASPGTFQLPPANVPAFRYLVLAHSFGGTLSTGDSCELFPFPWDDSYAVFKPTVVSTPPAPAEGGGPPGAVLLAAGAVVLLGLVGVLAFRRGSG